MPFITWTGGWRYSITLILAAIIGVQARGQSGTDFIGTGGRHVIQGRIVFPSGRRSDARLRVRLESNSNLSGDLSVLADMNGSFKFQGLRPGTYTVIVEGGESYETVRERIFIEPEETGPVRGTTPPRYYTVQIYLQPKGERRGEGKPEVVNSSLAGVPKLAADYYRKASELARQGATNEAIENLRQALLIYPDFTLAWGDLGVQYLKLKQFDKAVKALEAGLKLDHDDFGMLLTYGLVLLEKGEYGASADKLRRAIKVRNSSPLGHYYLGLVLIRQRKFDEAEDELRLASDLSGNKMASAHYYLGGIYWQRRDYRRAIDELESYLRLEPNAPNAERVRSTIKELREKQK